jgi:hypothetical protein
MQLFEKLLDRDKAGEKPFREYLRLLKRSHLRLVVLPHIGSGPVGVPEVVVVLSYKWSQCLRREERPVSVSEKIPYTGLYCDSLSTYHELNRASCVISTYELRLTLGSKLRVMLQMCNFQF